LILLHGLVISNSFGVNSWKILLGSLSAARVKTIDERDKIADEQSFILVSFVSTSEIHGENGLFKGGKISSLVMAKAVEHRRFSIC